MDVKQIFSFVNEAYTEAVGTAAILKEDLTGLVETGDAIFNANALDRYVKALVNRIGKSIFKAKKYTGALKNLMMEKWDFGSVLMKVRADIPEAQENESWNLEDKTSYDPNIFYQPKVSVKFYNKLSTFEIPCSFTEKQIKQSFTSAQEMNSFLSMIYTAIENGMSVYIEIFTQRAVNNMIAETIYDDYKGTALNASSHVKAVNLLKLYNDAKGTTLTKDKALLDIEFLRFSNALINKYAKRMTKITKLYNIDKKESFTNKEDLNVLVHTDYLNAVDTSLLADIRHNEYVKLPLFEEVVYWQGAGTSFATEDTTRIQVKSSGGHDIDVNYVVACMFDKTAVAVCNVDRRTTSNYNPKAEFYTNWAKWDAALINDFTDNFVVFFLA